MRMIFVAAGALALVSATSALADVAVPNNGFLNATASISLDGGPRQAGFPGFDFWSGVVGTQTYDAQTSFGNSGVELVSQTRATWTGGDGGGVRFDAQIVVPNVFAESVDATYADMPIWTYEFSTLSDATFDVKSVIHVTGDAAGQGKWDLLLTDDLGGASTFHLAPGELAFDLSAGRDYTVSLVSLDHVTEKNQTLKNFSNFVWSINERAAAVPEPGSWALMILGFGGVGGALRRRRLAPA